MDPSDDTELWQELEQLRGEVAEMSERHHSAVRRINAKITGLESRLGARGMASASPSPPPLPRQAIIPDRRVPVAAPVVEDFEEPVPQPPPEPEPTDEDGFFELDFGKVWFVRIGIVILLTGLVFLGNYAYQNWIREMPNGARLAPLFACALALVETGRRLAAKENLSRFGEVLLAGGMAFSYYCVFASHHVARLKVIDNPALAAVLLLGAAGAIASVSWLRKNQATAILGIVLASYSTMLQPIGWMSCVSSILLGGMGLFFMLRPGWSGPGWASMLGSYGAFLGWQILGASARSCASRIPPSCGFCRRCG